MSTKNATNIASSSSPRLYLNASFFINTRAAAIATVPTVKNGDVFRVCKTSSGFRAEKTNTTFPRDEKVPTLEGGR